MPSLFEAPTEPVRPWDAIFWWEKRRIPYNLIVGGVGVVSFILFITCIHAADGIEPGEDAVEPLALVLAPFLMNLAYTAGWVVDFPLRLVFQSLSPRITVNLFRLGLGISLLVVCFPSVFWGGYLLLKMAGVVG
ncbi:hypothetical protein [Prosthecobacter sp.]|uniref:hypothetical protein n=1 Tax=Prosthecobacter sp. TaxID=1965333 RepID=UPI00378479E6